MTAKPPLTRRAFVYGAGAALQAARSSAALRPQDELEKGFIEPPDSSKPWVFWWWLNGNVSREGITRDLEEMKRQGIAGVLLFHAGGGRGVPPGPRFLSTEWTGLFQFALQEGARLGMEVSVNLCDGWNSGGPWIEPEEANKRLVFSEIQVDGPGLLSRQLPSPPVIADYYRDVAVVAFREKATRPVQPAAVAVSSSLEGYCRELNWPPLDLVDGDPFTCWRANPKASPTPGQPQWIEWRYHEPLAATAIHLAAMANAGPCDCELQAAGEGGVLGAITAFAMEKGQVKRVAFPEVRAKTFRLLVKSAYAPDIQLAEAWILRAGDEVVSRPGIQWWWFKSGNRSFWDYPRQGPRALDEEHPEDGAFDARSAEVIDLGPHMNSDGRLEWNVPAGRWTVLRFGYTLLGQRTRESSTGNSGWEADMLDSRGIEKQFRSVAQPILEAAGSAAGRTLKLLHVDSYELGANLQGQQPTWSARFSEEFRKRRGYDLRPYLPALARRIIDSRERTNRFLWDVRRTIGDLMAEKFFARFAELAHARGVGIDCETGYGTYPHPHIDGLQCAGKCDVTMGEFWYGTDIMSQFDGFCNVVRAAASAAHVYGKAIVQAEAFTAWTHFQESPASLKPVGDLAFCDGLTRVVVHQYTHQPRLGPRPGIQYLAGTHLDRNLTWWEQAGAFLKYLARCQHLLQAGRFCADVCYFCGEGATSFVPGRDHLRPALPLGYDCDVINAEILLQHTSVQDGCISLKSGMQYRVLVLPEAATMSYGVLERIRQLVEAGATVVGTKPQRPPGLTGYPDSDVAMRRLAETLWGASTSARGGRSIGRGRLVWGKPLAAVLAEMSVPPDFDVRNRTSETSIRFIHRRVGRADVFFLSNQTARQESLACAFRVTGMAPELWDAVTGRVRPLPDWRQEGPHVIVPLHFEPHESWFVVFRQPARPPAARGRKNFPDLQPVRNIPGPWTVRFDPRWGGPESVVFDVLADWTQRPEEGVRYYSGTATYGNSFDLPPKTTGKRVFLELGQVNHLAEVRLNGKNLGVVWCAPWRVEITGVARRRDNRLEIDVVNLWPNRMIGDARLPPEKRFAQTNLTTYSATSPLIPSGLLGPVRLAVEA